MVIEAAAMTFRDRPKIGICDLSRNPSGISRYVNIILAGIDTGEFEVTLFCLRGGPHVPRSGINLVHVLDEAGLADSSPEGPSSGRFGLVELARSGWRLVPSPFRIWAGFLRQSSRLGESFRRWPVDILHTNIGGGCEESCVGGRLAAIPRVLATLHVDSTTNRRAMDWILEYLTNHSLHRAIAVSESTRAYWVRRTALAPSRVVTISNGVDPESLRRCESPGLARKELGLPDDGRLIIGSLGRLSPQKGYAHLLDAVALLADAHPELVVALAGEGPLRGDLARQAIALGLSERIHFLGHRRDVQTVYDAMDIFVLPSLYEAMPFALLEAMAMGLPVVATDVSGVPEAITPGEAGYLVRPGDPEALAASLRPLLDSFELRRRMGLAGRDRVIRHFSQSEMLGRTLDLYREMLSK